MNVILDMALVSTHVSFRNLFRKHSDYITTNTNEDFVIAPLVYSIIPVFCVYCRHGDAHFDMCRSQNDVNVALNATASVLKKI